MQLVVLHGSVHLLICVWKKPAPKLRLDPFTLCQLVSNVLGFCQISWSIQVSHLWLTLHFRDSTVHVTYCFILPMTLHELWPSPFLDKTQHKSILKILVHVTPLWSLLGRLNGRRACSPLSIYTPTHVIALAPCTVTVSCDCSSTREWLLEGKN